MIYIVLIAFAFFLSYSYKNGWKACTYLTAVYTLSLLFSIKLVSADLYYYQSSVLGSIAYTILIFAFFKPFARNLNTINGFSSKLQEIRFCKIAYVLSAVVILGMLLILPIVLDVLKNGLGDIRSMMYKDGSSSYMIKATGITRIGAIIVGWFNGFSYVFLGMFFYAFTFIERKRLLKVMLLVASLSASYQGLQVAGRTKIMYWMMMFLLLLYLFYPLLTNEKKNVIRKLSLVLLFPAVSYFMSVTFARTIGSNDTYDFLSSYLGQSYLNFCTFWESMNFDHVYTGRIFPLFHFIFGDRYNEEIYRDLIMNKTGLNIGIFYTMLGDFLVDIGKIGMLLYTAVYYVVANKILNKSVYSLPMLIIFIVIIQIPLHGLFYYSLWREESSFCTILAITIAYYLNKVK